MVSKRLHDRSLSFRSGIYAPRYFIPNRKILILNPSIGPKKAQKSSKKSLNTLDWLNFA